MYHDHYMILKVMRVLHIDFIFGKAICNRDKILYISEGFVAMKLYIIL